MSESLSLRQSSALGAQNERSSGAIVSLKPVFAFLTPYRWHIVGATVALLVTAGATLAVGQAVRVIVDGGFDSSALRANLPLLLGIIVPLTLGTFVRFFLVSWIGERVSADLRNAVYEHVIGLDVEFFERNAAAEIQTRIVADTTLLQTLIGSSVSVALRNLVMGVGGLLLMVISNPRMSMWVLLTVPLVIAPIVLFGRRVRRLSRDSQDRLADVGEQATESLQQIKVVKAFNRETAERERFRSRVEETFRVSVRRIRTRAILTAIVMLFVSCALAFLVWMGAEEVAAGHSSGGSIAAFLFYSIIVAGSVGAITEVLGDLQRSAGATERLMELLHAPLQLPRGSQQIATPLQGVIEFHRVGFVYPTRPDVLVLQDIQLRIEPLQTIALVGPSGGGKSTLLELILRYYDPNAGYISFDGVDIRALDLAWYRSHMAVVPQQPVLFSGTLKANLLVGNAAADDAAIRDVLQVAQLLEWVDAQPLGLATEVGAFGGGLSGGQRQRVAIARALLRRPSLLLLDEATSALDSESEAAFQRALDGIAKRCTTIIIAHRLATVQNADRIVVVDEGRIAASGTHQALLATSPLYARLAAQQQVVDAPR